MARAIMMCGISGSGKTTRAKEFERQGFVLLSLDREIYKRVGIRKFEEMTFEQRKELSQKTEAEILQHMISLLREGHDVVYDSTMCKRFKREAFRRAALQAGVKAELEFLDADFDTLLVRLKERTGNYGPDAFPVSEEELRGFMKGFEKPDSEELDLYK